MNLAEETIDFLFAEHLRIDEQWSYLLPTGFTWWADRNAQTIEFVGEETGPAGESGYLICVRTELLRDLDLDDDALAGINTYMERAAMAGPVYDARARRLDLCSLARVDETNSSWIRYLLGAAAVLQVAEARLLGPVLADAVGALPADSGHPAAGIRETPDEIAFAAGVFVHDGAQPCRWDQPGFDALAEHLRRLPSVRSAATDGQVVSAEFDYGSAGPRTSSCEIRGDRAHPLYGNGLLITQRFGIHVGSDSDGITLALSLNAADLAHRLTGYGFGSYGYADRAIHFTGFVPNALYRPGLLAALGSSCAARALAMSDRLADGRWDAERYSTDAEVLARREQRLAHEQRPVAAPIRGCPMRARAGD